MSTNKIKKGDNVKIITGKDKGKEGGEIQGWQGAGCEDLTAGQKMYKRVSQK